MGLEAEGEAGCRWLKREVMEIPSVWSWGQHPSFRCFSCHFLTCGLHNCPDSCLCCPVMVRMDIRDSAFKAHGIEMRKC